MTSPQVYNIHFRLYGVNHLQDQLLDLLYTPAYTWHTEQLQKYTNSASDKPFVEATKETLESIQRLRAQTQIRNDPQEEALDVQFPIAHRPEFDEQNQDGFRPWLRNHINDMFYHSVLVNVFSHALNLDVFGTPMQKTYEQVFYAFKQAFAQSDNTRGSTFWIEHERAADDIPQPHASNALQPEGTL